MCANQVWGIVQHDDFHTTVWVRLSLTSSLVAADDEQYTQQGKQHYSRQGYMLSHMAPSVRCNLG